MGSLGACHLPQFADDFSTEAESPAARLDRLLRGQTSGIAPGIAGTRPETRAAPRSALPIWVQERLRRQEAEERLRQAQLAEIDAAGLGLTSPPSARPAPPAPLPRPLEPPRNPTLAPLLQDDRLFDPLGRTDRLREILDGSVRGTAAGMGRVSSSPSALPRPAPPASRSEDSGGRLFDDRAASGAAAPVGPERPPGQTRPLQVSAPTERALTETLIDIFKRGEFTEAEIQYANGFSQQTQQLAALIAQLEESGRRVDRERAQRLRAGEPVGDPFAFLDRAAESARDAVERGVEFGVDAATIGIGVGRDAGDAASDFALDRGGQAVDLTRDAAEAAFRILLDQGREAAELTRDTGDAAFDFALDRGGDALRFLEPFDTGVVNPIIGQAIADWTDCADQRVLPPIRPGGPPVTIHENCGDHWVFDRTGGRAFTVGSHVFEPRTLDRDGATEWEELFHAADYEKIGDLFLLRYALQQIAHGYLDNEFEQAARQFAAEQTAPPGAP